MVFLVRGQGISDGDEEQQELMKDKIFISLFLYVTTSLLYSLFIVMLLCDFWILF